MTFIYTTLCLLLALNSIYAFNFKSLLFGETHEQDPSLTSSVTFGIPVPDTVSSSRKDIPCKNYICEDTNICVDKPINCPCRSSLDKKCTVGDWYICINKDELCEEL